MKRYEEILEIVEYPEDIKYIKKQVPELRILTDAQVSTLWREYSDTYAAGWLIVNGSVERFKKWILEEV